uniref:Uncharacterized protein n=1 Tax=Pararge aegeria TaxID=116150 RepID=S4PZR8_9NEOP
MCTAASCLVSNFILHHLQSSFIHCSFLLLNGPKTSCLLPPTTFVLPSSDFLFGGPSIESLVSNPLSSSTFKFSIPPSLFTICFSVESVPLS